MRPERKRAWLVAMGGVATALPACLYLWGFMVDDALIIARYASHLHAGHGYRFNATGPSTDGVTSLPFALLLAPLASGVWGGYRAAKLLGLLGWLLGAGALAVAVDGLALGRRKWAGWALLMGG